MNTASTHHDSRSGLDEHFPFIVPGAGKQAVAHGGLPGPSLPEIEFGGCSMNPNSHSSRSLRHFHLVSDEDLIQLRPVVELVLGRHDEIVGKWYQLYHFHFGASRSLSEDEVARIFAPMLEREAVLMKGNVDAYAARGMRVGQSLVEHHVPLEEVIALIHLFKQAAQALFPQNPPPPDHLHTIFDKLNYVWIVLIVSAYLGSHSAIAGARLTAPQGEAADLSSASRNLFRGLVGATAPMRLLYDRIEAAGATRGNLLIIGETGTGKELIARAIHECGPGEGRPFVALNCAALPKDLIESELFGYKRGAFSGATTEYVGLFRSAEGGTLFLDEISEMSAETQSKLLRAIQERAIRPIGTTREIPVDVRVIASTNRDPKKAVAEGHLREDLYYRLQAAVLSVPPLRERRSDIPLLVGHFIAVFSQRLGRTVAGIEQQALEELTNHPWPGNVRELSNVIEGALTFGKNLIIGLQDLPRAAWAAPCESSGWNSPTNQIPFATFAETERDLILRALHSTGGNKVAAAARLRISRKKLYAKISKYRIAEPPFARPPGAM
jgi:DNA-binding NtrC family response regulator